MAALLHFALQRKQVGILKKQQGKATHEGVMQARVNPLSASRVGEGGDGLRDQFEHRLQGQADEGTHDVSLQLMSQ
jgi:hypothetical protein